MKGALALLGLRPTGDLSGGREETQEARRPADTAGAADGRRTPAARPAATKPARESGAWAAGPPTAIRRRACESDGDASPPAPVRPPAAHEASAGWEAPPAPRPAAPVNINARPRRRVGRQDSYDHADDYTASHAFFYIWYWRVVFLVLKCFFASSVNIAGGGVAAMAYAATP